MSKSTIYSVACNQVAGFQQMYKEFTRKLVIKNKTKSTHENYLHQMSKLALYYKRSPLDMGIGELKEYLYCSLPHKAATRLNRIHFRIVRGEIFLIVDKTTLIL